MSAALGLLRLQYVDSQLDQLENELGRIRLKLKDDLVESAARQAVESAESEQREAEASRGAAERQAKTQRTKLQHAESQLYGGSVRNPKELQDLQADVASLRKHLATLDQAELDWMERLEAAEERFRQARQQLDHVMTAQGVEKEILARQEAEFLSRRNSLEVERRAAAESVSAPWLELYGGLRRARAGIAVAEVQDAACAACGTSLSAALQQSARHAADLVLCPSCGRILYAE
jgi:predicted  nucleic acid-binding Zn-ribbon protein